MKDLVRIKPHHFVDIITALAARGVSSEPHPDGHAGMNFGAEKLRDYLDASHPYGNGAPIVSERVLRDHDTLLEIIELGADDICEPCKHNLDGLCDDIIEPGVRPGAPRSKHEWARRLDERWCERLQVKQGDRLTAQELCERLRDLAGDIADIYRETPDSLTAGRARSLKEGIEKYLE